MRLHDWILTIDLAQLLQILFAIACLIVLTLTASFIVGVIMNTVASLARRALEISANLVPNTGSVSPTVRGLVPTSRPRTNPVISL